MSSPRPLLCDACLTRDAFGVLTLTDRDGHQIAAWWTCCQCADHDAPLHDARGLTVAVIVPDFLMDAP